MVYPNNPWITPGVAPTSTPTWSSPPMITIPEEEYRRVLQKLQDLHMQIHTIPPAPIVIKDKQLSEFQDPELIFEMIGRGYAVAKMPAEELAAEVVK